jgi:hypothetical protein
VEGAARLLPGMSEKPPPDEAFHLTGDRLGKFMILAELGRGSMGVVYEAFQEDLKRKVALKILPANITLDAKQVRRFHREAESVARLRHDNVIQIYEVGQIDSTHYFAMELVEGRPLDPEQMRDREGVLRAARIARDAARGLAHAHEKGVIHRDVKPGNLLVDRAGHVVVTDFGLARLTDSASLTSTDAIVGTPKYMSPEQILAHARKPVDGRADIYSLGATLYHLVAGRPPFDAPTVQGFIKAILEERPPSPRRFNRQIPFDLATIILRCLEKDPADRYASATDLADDIDRFLAGERILAKPKGTLALAAEALRRHRVIAALATVSVIAVFLVLVLGGKARQESERAKLEAKLRDIAAEPDLDVAVSDIERFCAEHPDNEVARAARARIYHDRAMQELQKPEDKERQEDNVHWPKVLTDLEHAGERDSFWYLMALLEANRTADARTAAEALPEGSPLRRLTLARIALKEERYADVIHLLSEPALVPGYRKESLVFSALTRGAAHRALGQTEEAKAQLQLAAGQGDIDQPWLRARALGAVVDVLPGADLKDFLASIAGTVTESLRTLASFGKLTPDELGIVRHLVDSVLKLAGQQPVPPTTLERIAQERIGRAEGEERALARLLLAIAQMNLDRIDVALTTLDEAEGECAPAVEPYVCWLRALAYRLQGDSGDAVESAQQAIVLALALPKPFPDLEQLCRHAALLAEEAPEGQSQRVVEFLRERLGAMKPAPDWVSALLARLAAVPAPSR